MQTKSTPEIDSSTLKLDLLSRQSSSSNSKVVFGKIRLNNEITPANFYGSWISIAMVGIVLTSTATLEPAMLRNKFGVSEQRIGTTESLLLGIDYAVKIFCAMIFGPMIDKFGRKMMFIFGFIVAACGYFLVPMSTTLYSSYIPFKSITSVGVIALQILPLNADYVQNASKGLSAGLQYTLSFFGAACSAVLLHFLNQLGLSMSYYGVGLLLLALGVVNSFLLKPGNKYYLKNASDENEGEGVDQKSWKQNASQIWKHICEVPWIGISIVTSALTYSDIYLITGITLWMQSFTKGGSFEEATAKTTRYQMIFAGCSFVSSLVYGFVVQKLNLLRFILGVMLVAMTGFVFVTFVDNPDSIYLYILFFWEGLSLPGVILFSTFCAIRYNPPMYRGTLQGMGLIFGMIGAITILVLGGILYDRGVHESAFYLYGVMMILVFMMVVGIYYLTGGKNYQDKKGAR